MALSYPSPICRPNWSDNQYRAESVDHHRAQQLRITASENLLSAWEATFQRTTPCIGNRTVVAQTMIPSEGWLRPEDVRTFVDPLGLARTIQPVPPKIGLRGHLIECGQVLAQKLDDVGALSRTGDYHDFIDIPAPDGNSNFDIQSHIVNIVHMNWFVPSVPSSTVTTTTPSRINNNNLLESSEEGEEEEEDVNGGEEESEKCNPLLMEHVKDDEDDDVVDSISDGMSIYEEEGDDNDDDLNLNLFQYPWETQSTSSYDSTNYSEYLPSSSSFDDYSDNNDDDDSCSITPMSSSSLRMIDQQRRQHLNNNHGKKQVLPSSSNPRPISPLLSLRMLQRTLMDVGYYRNESTNEIGIRFITPWPGSHRIFAAGRVHTMASNNKVIDKILLNYATRAYLRLTTMPRAKLKRRRIYNIVARSRLPTERGICIGLLYMREPSIVKPTYDLTGVSINDPRIKPVTILVFQRGNTIAIGANNTDQIRHAFTQMEPIFRACYRTPKTEKQEQDMSRVSQTRGLRFMTNQQLPSEEEEKMTTTITKETEEMTSPASVVSQGPSTNRRRQERRLGLKVVARNLKTTVKK